MKIKANLFGDILYFRKGKHRGAQVNACANERDASKLAISKRERPSVNDEVINVNVIVRKIKAALFFLL